MNKNILLLIIVILLTSLLPAQLKNLPKNKPSDIQGIEVKGSSFIIKLNDGTYKFNNTQKGKFTIRDYSDYSDPSKAGEYKLPERTFLIAIPPNSKAQINIIESKEELINNVIPELNPKSKGTQITRSSLPKPLLEITNYTWFRDYYCAVVRLNDISFNDLTSQLVIHKGIKFEVKISGNINISSVSPIPLEDNELKDMIINSDMAGQFRGKPQFVLNDTTGSWFKYSQPYVKVGTGGEGLFRITKNDLINLGIDPSSINPQTFQLFESGVEQSIYVSNEASGVFSDSDYVEFFGTRNFPKISPKIINADNEEYNEYLNRYTDTTFYFLTWGITNGKRAYSVSNPANGISDTLIYYSSVIHHEPNVTIQFLNSTDEVANQTPNWNKNKSWYWGLFHYSPGIFSDAFQLQDIYPGKTAKAFFKLVSVASSRPTNSHNLTFYINNILLDSQAVDLNKQVVLKGNINSDNLNNGSNTFTLHNINNSTDPNDLELDWSELEYPKYINLTGDSLYFEFRDNFVNQISVIKIGNAASTIDNYEIFKVKPFFKKISNAQIIQGNIFFSDTINTNDAYVILNHSNISKPKFYYKKNFVNLRQSRQADYIAITHPSFISASQNYVNNIAQLYSVNPLLVNVNDIYDEFAFGYPYPQSIKDFIGNSLQTWQSPLPSYLLLIGDADYDYKQYERSNFGIVGGGNFIPAFGFPVSDVWYSVFSDSVPLPQLKVGRIPINKSSDLDYYLSKVQNNFDAPFGDWNKHYLFFSGGDPENPFQLYTFKTVNDSIISGYVKPKPLAGNYINFYKTVDPPSNFGPYTAEQINSAISRGSVFISYLGHSGTSTWDNGIAFINQLQNDVNRNPLITDFGCSTNKFAEPDIVCFGENFILSGQAIGYIANSSLGFTSTAITAPLYFYSSIIQDSIYQVGEAHFAAKNKMFNAFGSSNIFKIFSLTNTLLGDPIVKIKIPSKPNFSISPSDIIVNNKFINETIDSVKVLLVINNFGTSLNDSVRIDISHSFKNAVIQTQSFYIPVPDYKDTIPIWLKTGQLSGSHTLNVTLNSDNRIPEIYTTDNSVSFDFLVESAEVKFVIEQKVENPGLNHIILLNPSLSELKGFNYVYQFSKDVDFTNPIGSILPAQTFYTNLQSINLNQNQRYWFRVKVDGTGKYYSGPVSFLNGGSLKFLLNDSFAFDNQTKDSVVYSNGKLLLGDTVRISVISAGTYAGPLCTISKNGVNLLANSYFSGMGIVVFDPVTLIADTSAWYNLFNNPPALSQLAALINSIPEGKIVAMGVCDDAENNLNNNDSLKNAIKTLGSTLIDQLAFRGSWALIGKKGAVPGEVIEQIRLPYNGLVAIDTLINKEVIDGKITTNLIGPASIWDKIVINQSIPSGSEIKYKLLGVQRDSITIDTLGYIPVIDSLSLGFVDAQKYPHLKIVSELNLGTGSIPPSISSFGVNYKGIPELGTNYQAVTLSSDTFNVGKTGSLGFSVYNAGESRADSVKVIVRVRMSDNSTQQIYETVLDTVNAESRRQLTVNYNPPNGTRSRDFVIQIDPENKIYELYKDNNTFIQPFNVKSDSLPAQLKITFDKQDILDGDYVSPNPDIKIELNDPTVAAITDTSAVAIMLNNVRIYYNDPAVTYAFNSSNPKMVVNYKPKLNEGSYTLTVLGKDAYGLLFDSTGTKKNFLVSDNAKILYAYNYPDPMNKDTYFTFKLTQLPDELKINIYTVAGRLIRQITKSSSELSYDFNRIYWDGKDQDGDTPANGVYFYKIILSKDGKKENITQKMAIIR